MKVTHEPGCPYGVHRVIEPQGVLPQAAWKIDNSPVIRDNEILIDVSTLNIDAASFKQIVSTAKPGATPDEVCEHVAQTVLDIVSQRGKMHNPVTGSGGMLLGRVKEFGPKAPRRGTKEGDFVATLVSLSLTPLKIDRIKEVHLDKDQVDIEGTAVVFESGPFAVIPPDFRKTLALATLDVAGAPAQVARLVGKGDTVLVLGAGGKSGLISLAVAREKAGPEGKIIAVAHGKASTERAKRLGVCDVVLSADAKDAIGTMKAVLEASGGKKADITINCVSVPGTEMASILCTRNRGKVYFFSMATSFTAAALGAEGVGADVELIIGNGYAENHADIALDLLRRNKELRGILEEMFPGE
ncbi:MAG TPA: zinc-binding dehydrogenase [Firmicutes bacterium]|nr:zinc-binding dehydrogenase [Candidatus Fermentithermobacillaceae bacterium]